WGPGFRLLLGTEAGDEGGVELVGFVALQLTLREALDAGWIDDTDGVAGVVEEVGEVIAIAGGGFHTGVQALRAVFDEPGLQLRKACRGVIKAVMMQLAVVQQSGVE